MESLNGTYPSEAAFKVLQALEAAGLEAWLVGGWVRDALMGTPCHDIDMCCSGTWQQSEEALKAAGIAVVRSGIKFGGLTAVCDDERIEVTSYRSDGFYKDGRHPEDITKVSSVEEDLARRDFTVNAMAWHPQRGVLDLYNGQGDIERKLIKAVGEPKRRFEEDALRMLRAVRFGCRLDFKIEPQTAAALGECAPLLDQVARERVGWELDGILATGHGGDAMLHSTELVCAAIPELSACVGFDQHSIYHAFDVYEHIARVLTVCGELSLARGGGVSRSLMWAAMLHDVAKPACFTMDDEGHGHFYGHPEKSADVAKVIMRRLGLPTDLIHEVFLLVKYHDRPVRLTRSNLLTLMRQFSGEGVDTERLMDELFDLKIGDALGKAPRCFSFVEELEEMRDEIHGLLKSGAAYSLKTLDLAGGDLIKAGMKPGPQIGEALNQALTMTINGEVANKKEMLLEKVLEL